MAGENSDQVADNGFETRLKLIQPADPCQERHAINGETLQSTNLQYAVKRAKIAANIDVASLDCVQTAGVGKAFAARKF